MNNIAYLIQSQFPSIYQNEGKELIAFMEAYYEWIETTKKMSVHENKNFLESVDIDTTMDEFIEHFKEVYLKDFPFIMATDKRFLVKNIMDFYQSKGSKKSLELLMRILFNQDAEIYFPGSDILRVSDSQWYRPTYIEVSKSDRTLTFLDKQITGASTKSKAFVEGVIRKRVDGKIVDIVYLSDLRGDFKTGEQITDDGRLADAPRILGSMTTVNIELGGRESKIGDVFDVITKEGRRGKVRVTGTEDATGRVDFTIENPGYGYTNTTDGTASNVYISDGVIFTNNPASKLIQFEEVIQRIEEIRILSATGLQNLQNGDIVVGRTSAGANIVTGSVISVANVSGNGAVINGPSANVMVKVQLAGDTTFTQQIRINTADGKQFSNGEMIEEESEVRLDMSSITGTFQIGEQAEQKVYTETGNDSVLNYTTVSGGLQLILDSTEGLVRGQNWVKLSGTGATPNASGTYIDSIINSTAVSLTNRYMSLGTGTGKFEKLKTLKNYAFGKVAAANATSVTLEDAWGNFDTDYALNGITSGAVGDIASVFLDSTLTGARAVVTSVAPTYITVKDVMDRSNGNRIFNNGNKIRGMKTKIIDEVVSSSTTGANILAKQGAPTANGIIDIVTRKYAKGMVIGANSIAFGVWGNTEPFFYSEDGEYYVETVREKLIDPPRNPDGSILNLNMKIDKIATGVGADFQIGNLEDTETLTLNTDHVNDDNISGIPYLNIRLDGGGSGVGFVTGTNIVVSGNAYINNASLTFTGGGLNGGEPIVPASGIIRTNANGSITLITLTNLGEGYFSAPTITLPPTTGQVANLTPIMDYGYGFEKNPMGDEGTIIADVLTSEIFTIGKIASLTRINPGRLYNVDPFVTVRNDYIASFARRDIIIYVSDIVGAFLPGEELLQIVPDGLGSTTTAKGTVKEFELTGAGTGVLHVQRNSFNAGFIQSIPITGERTSSTAFVETITDDLASSIMGENAVISGKVIAANGIVTSVEVIDSGYGYIDKGPVTLFREGFPYVVSARSFLGKQGIGEGYWKTNNSQLNSEKKIQDNRYYQEFSYDVLSGVSLNRYKGIINQVLHVSGNQIFGQVVKYSTAKNPITAVTSSLTIG